MRQFLQYIYSFTVEPYADKILKIAYINKEMYTVEFNVYISTSLSIFLLSDQLDGWLVGIKDRIMRFFCSDPSFLLAKRI